MLSCSVVSNSVTPFFKQEYWNGLPCPPPGDLLNPGIESRSLHCRWILYHLSHHFRGYLNSDFLGGASGKEPICQHRRYHRCGFNPWVRKISWKRKWQLIPVFLLEESHGHRILAGYSPRGRNQSDTTECLHVLAHTHTHTHTHTHSLPVLTAS